MTINTIFQVDGTSQEWDTEQEAIIHEAIHETDGLYLESYTLKKLVKMLSHKFLFLPIVEVQQITQEEHERINNEFVAELAGEQNEIE